MRAAYYSKAGARVSEADILATFNRHAIVRSPPTVLFLCSMIRPSLPIKERSQRRSA